MEFWLHRNGMKLGKVVGTYNVKKIDTIQKF